MSTPYSVRGQDIEQSLEAAHSGEHRFELSREVGISVFKHVIDRVLLILMFDRSIHQIKHINSPEIMAK